ADAANPQFAFWRDVIKTPLLKDDGQAYFDMTLKGFGLPGKDAIPGTDKIKGKLISMEPATKPKKLILAVEKPDVADTTLIFEEALPGTMEAGGELQFSGEPSEFMKQPFNITFKVEPDDLMGWTGKNAGKQTKAAPKGGAAKGKGKAKGN